MKAVIIVVSILGLCLSAPVKQGMDRNNEPVIGEGQQFVVSPLDQTDPISRNIFFPVPRTDNFFTNPFLSYHQQYYPYYPYYSQYSSNPYYPAYTLPPVIISLPQRNP